MKQRLIRLIRINFTRFVMRFFWLFPMKQNQIFFSSYEGKQYSCNPKVIFEAICRDPEFKDFRFVWEINDKSKHAFIHNKNTKFCRHNSFSYFYMILTSKYIITNTGITARIPLRKSQISINTWHGGGAYKRVGHAIHSDISGDLKELDIASAQTTYFLSSSRIFTNVMEDSIQMPKDRFIPTGMPRNDIFFDARRCTILREKIINEYKLDNGCFLILYAPTYRGAVGKNTFNFDLVPLYHLREVAEKRFGRRAVLMIRTHYYSDEKTEYENALSVSDYPDMQELLVAADLLVTDYSSSIWDFGLSGKPCILYTPDIEEYDLERGFYTFPSTWPGILCETESRVIEAIDCFDSDAYKKQLEKYFLKAGSYDKGDATEKVLRIIKERQSQ